MPMEEFGGSSEHFRAFKRALRFIKEIIEQGDGSFAFSPNKTIFEIRGELDVDALLSEHELDRDEISGPISEIVKDVTQILSGEKDRFKMVAEKRDGKKDRSMRHERMALVEEELIDEKLKRQFFLQRTYKTALLDKFDWEIIEKKHCPERCVKSYPTAFLRLRVKKPFTDNPPVLKTETVVFETNIDELEWLVDELNDLKRQLNSIA